MIAAPAPGRPDRVPLLTDIRALLGQAGLAEPGSVAAVTPLAGGSISDVSLVRLATGRTLVVKTAPQAPAGMFAAEAAGLDAIGRTVRTPAVLGGGPGRLALEELGPCPEGPAPGFWAEAGRAIARLHGVPGDRYGWPSDNWLGRLPQRNDWSEVGHEFFATRRILRYMSEPTVTAALEPARRRALERICDRLPELIPASPPVLAHGDLWRGNTLAAGGRPAFIDPAVCWMWAETDLSMMYCTAQFGSRRLSAAGPGGPAPPAPAR
ncbi:MAG: fructosamine kinase family protein [Streptosporangiaceae bacterium]